MTNRLRRLHSEAGQSPWLDNLQRAWLRGGELQRFVDRGVRGITSNPTIFAKAMQAASYDEQLHAVLAGGATVEDAYWELVVDDIVAALDVLRPVYDASDGADGFVSVEVDPRLAHDTEGTVAAARRLWQRIARPNLLVKVPATAAGLPAIERLIGEGISVNVTLIFSQQRYHDVREAHLAGLEAAAARSDAPLAAIAGVASFFVSRVDAEVDKRLEALGTPEALALRGRAAIANAKVAFAAFRDTFSGERWAALEARGARVQRPLWASTSTKNPAYPDTLYVDGLIGPDTVNTLPDATLEAFEDHGTIARTIDEDLDGARSVLDRLARLGIKMDEVTDKLEVDGVASFIASFDEVLATLAGRSRPS